MKGFQRFTLTVVSIIFAAVLVCGGFVLAYKYIEPFNNFLKTEFAGAQGDRGEDGESIVGPQGPAGNDGQDGEPGAVGPQGPQGEPGTSAPVPIFVTGNLADFAAAAGVSQSTGYLKNFLDALFTDLTVEEARTLTLHVNTAANLSGYITDTATGSVVKVSTTFSITDLTLNFLAMADGQYIFNGACYVIYNNSSGNSAYSYATVSLSTIAAGVSNIPIIFSMINSNFVLNAQANLWISINNFTYSYYTTAEV